MIIVHRPPARNRWLHNNDNDIASGVQNVNCHIKTFFANASSIRNKTTAIEFSLSSATYDIILFVQTYLTCDDATAKFLVGANDEYDLFRYDRTNRAGGGVAVCDRLPFIANEY